MSFISYAQNFEDVMLWRALKHIDRGFYIDVGANDPDQDSVTRAFYERGWRGINVEPVPQWFELLEKARPRDINLQLAIGAEPGVITLYEIPDTGLSTAEKKFAERHEAERGYQIRELSVKMDTISGVCERYHLGPIHFLKIDVEGMEKAVFQGSDLRKIRPWIILVEATLPNSQEATYSDWEPLLLNAEYEYAYFDGLNRYYIAGEHKNLNTAFKAPPNVFDDFIRSEHLEAGRRAREAEAKVKEIEQRASQAEARAQESETKARQAEERASLAEARAQQAQQWAAEVKAHAHETEIKARQAEERATQAEARMQQAQQRASQAEARAKEAQTKAQQAEERGAQAEAKAEQVGVKAQQVEAREQKAQRRAAQVEARAQEAENKFRQAEATLQAVFSSRSWRVTEPLRWLANNVRLLREKENARGVIGASLDKTSNGSVPEPALTAPEPLPVAPPEPMELSPRAREIYFQLKAAIEKD